MKKQQLILWIYLALITSGFNAHSQCAAPIVVNVDAGKCTAEVSIALPMHNFGASIGEGTEEKPFTSLVISSSVINGAYFFNINGNIFTSIIEDGWILIASSSKTTSLAVLTETASLTLQSNSILAPSVFVGTSISSIRINATGLSSSSENTPLDVTTSSRAVLVNLRENRALSAGLELGTNEWIGTGKGRMGGYGPIREEVLAESIFHAGGNQTGLHWLPYAGYYNVNYSGGKNDLNLWIKAELNYVNNYNDTSDASGVYAVGTTNVVWTATDASGNSSSCTQTVTVVDDIAPTVIAHNITIDLGANGEVAIDVNDIDNGSTDNCGNLSFSLSKTRFNCDDVNRSVAIPIELIGSEAQRTYQYGGGYNPNTNEFWYPKWATTTVYTFDASHSLTGSFTAPVGEIWNIWMDKTSSDYYTANNTFNTINKVSSGSVAWEYDMKTSAGAVTTNDEYAFALALNSNIIVVIDKVTGLLVKEIKLPGVFYTYGGLIYANGNFYIAGYDVDGFSTIPKTWSAIHTFDANTGAYINSVSTVVGAFNTSFDGEIIWVSDNTGTSTIYGYKIANGNAYNNAGQSSVNTVILTTTDASGNSATATAVVTVIDPNAANVTFTAPADLCSSAGVQRSLGGGLPSGGVYSGNGVTDDRNGTSYSFDPAAAGAGTHSIRYTFTNASGCAASASDNIAVLEPTGPVVDVITVTVNGSCGSYAGFYNATSMFNDKKSYVSTTGAGNIISFNGTKWVLQQSGGSMRVLFENSTVSADVTPPLTGWIATRYCSSSSMEVGLGINLSSTARAEDLARVTTGANLQFYDVATAGTPLRSAERLTKTVYYVSDTDTATGCESKRTEFNVNIEGGGGRTRTRTRNTKFASSSDKTALDTEGFESKVLFSMYPNPSAENVTLSSSMDGDFRIFNLAGQVVKTFTLKANLETVVYVGDLSAGTYVVKPTNSSSISSQKLIIRK
jgi:hypothetical protein